MNLKLPLIYPITDTRLSGLSHAEQVRRLIAGGATFIQLREKNWSPGEFYEDAAAAVAVAQAAGVRILINDRVDVAVAVGADGVHLGQNDMPVEAARELLGPGAIVGHSTDSVVQAVAAASLPVDYVAIGPVFATATKSDSSPVVGLAGVRAVRAAIGDIPLVAIGGIDKENLDTVIAAGADSAAMISAMVVGDIEQNLRQLLSK